MKNVHMYNFYGECIDTRMPKLASPDYGTYNENGIPVPYWTPENEFIDKDGFDKTRILSNGSYKELIELPKGTMLCRYGYSIGKLTTLKGTDYDKLGLPYLKETVEYY